LSAFEVDGVVRVFEKEMHLWAGSDLLPKHTLRFEPRNEDFAAESLAYDVSSDLNGRFDAIEEQYRAEDDGERKCCSSAKSQRGAC
jgi:hypothetical protein